MASVHKTEKYTVYLTEQTLIELVKAVNEAKETKPNANVIIVSSAYSSAVKFEIRISPNLESLGYKLSSTGGDGQAVLSGDMDKEKLKEELKQLIERQNDKED